jgi:hypothetical protein
VGEVEAFAQQVRIMVAKVVEDFVEWPVGPVGGLSGSSRTTIIRRCGWRISERIEVERIQRAVVLALRSVWAGWRIVTSSSARRGQMWIFD